MVIRLSRVMENSTSVERQLEVCEDLCRQRGWEVVGVASDTDVSGAVDPFDRKKRPELASWLADRRPEFDVIVAYRADRLTRSIRHLQRLVHWAEDNGKLIVSATEPHFDMTSPFAAVLVALIGMVGEMELQAISERNASTARRNIRLGKYRGSTPPWGYRPEQDEAGDWRLVQDPEQVAVIREVVERVLAGEPVQRIAFDLTDRGVPTVKDRMAQLRGKPMKGTGWSQTVLKRSLISDAMLGYVVSSGKALRAEDGSPIQRSEPILTREELERVRVELSSRGPKVEKAAPKQSLLTGVLICGMCGERAYRFNGGSHAQFSRYRCRSVNKGSSCGNTSISAPDTDEIVEKNILGLIGSSERKEKVWHPGSDHSAELAEINAELVDLTGLIGSPAYRTGSPQRTALDARIEALASRQEQLERQEVTQAGWDWVGTGEVFGEWWAGLDKAEKCQWLRSMNVTVRFDRDRRLKFEFADLRRMLEWVDAYGSPVEVQRQMLERMGDTDIEGLEVKGDLVTVHMRDGLTFSYRWR